MTKCVIILVAVFSMLYTTNGYKILFVSPMPGKSHAILGEGLIKHLTEAGHEITYIAAMRLNKPQPSVTFIDVSETTKSLKEDGPLNIKAVMDKKTGGDLLSFIGVLMDISRATVENPNVQKLLKDKNQKFDLVILEWLFTEIYAGFAGVFDCPIIWLSTVEAHWMVLQLIDEIPNPAYNADSMSNSIPPFSFGQRVKELGLQILGTLLQKFYISRIENELYEKLFISHIRDRGNPVPKLQDLKYNASLVLSNSHVSMGVATRLPHNFIPIGGYHIDTVLKPLPQELQKIMDNAKHGVIYFSMGSNLRSKHFPDVVKQELLKVFGELKQTVLWKFEEDLPNRPSNVYILDWAPQQSILAHNNSVLFITHGGLLSTTETIHFGVPIIGIPVFADQFVNVERAVKKGYAKKVDLSYNIAKDLKIAISEIINDQRYSMKVKELSVVYHDRPVHPSKELVHWVEHVVKTGGAPHLRSPALVMPWYQKLYLDLVFVLILIFIALRYVFRLICSLIGKKKVRSNKKTN